VLESPGSVPQETRSPDCHGTPNSSIPDEPLIHPLARREQDVLKDSTVDGRGFLSPLDPRAISHLSVTAAGLPRAIKALSTLLYALEQRGHVVSRENDGDTEYRLNAPHPKLIALIHGEKISFRLVESVRLKPGTATKSFIRRRTSPKFDYRSSTLTLYLQSVEFYNVSRKRSDHRHQRIEDCIEDIVSEFTRTAAAIKQAREDLERAHQEVEKRRLREAEERKQEKTLSAAS